MASSPATSPRRDCAACEAKRAVSPTSMLAGSWARANLGVVPATVAQGVQIEAGLIAVLDAVSELNKDVAVLKNLPMRVSDLEHRLAVSERRNEEMRSELTRTADALAVVSSLVSRIARDEGDAQAALTKLADETRRLQAAVAKATPRPVVGSPVRNFGRMGGGGGASSAAALAHSELGLGLGGPL